MMDSPGFQESFCLTCREFGATVTGEFIGDAEGGECPSKTGDEASAASARSLDDRPARVPIDDDEIRLSHVREVVSAHLLEGIVWRVNVFGGSTRLRRGVAVAWSTSVSRGTNVRRDAWPVDTHGCPG